MILAEESILILGLAIMFLLYAKMSLYLLTARFLSSAPTLFSVAFS